MFNIGDYIGNQNTEYLGKVIGYGHRIVVYTTTLKVLVAEAVKCLNATIYITLDCLLHSDAITWLRGPSHSQNSTIRFSNPSMRYTSTPKSVIARAR